MREKHLEKARRLTGPAAKRFHSSAMGKFLMNVPIQMEGGCYGSGIIALTWRVRPW